MGKTLTTVPFLQETRAERQGTPFNKCVVFH